MAVQPLFHRSQLSISVFLFFLFCLFFFEGPPLIKNGLIQKRLSSSRPTSPPPPHTHPHKPPPTYTLVTHTHTYVHTYIHKYYIYKYIRIYVYKYISTHKKKLGKNIKKHKIKLRKRTIDVLHEVFAV